MCLVTVLLCPVNFSVTTIKHLEKLKLTNLVSVQVFALLYTLYDMFYQKNVQIENRKLKKKLSKSFKAKNT